MATDCLHTHRLSQHSTEQIWRFAWWLIWLPEWIKHLSHHSSPACHTEHWQLSPLNMNKDYRIWVLFLDILYFKSNMIHMSGTSPRVLSLSNPDKRSITFVVWKFSTGRNQHTCRKTGRSKWLNTGAINQTAYSRASNKVVFSIADPACSISGPWRVVKVKWMHKLIAWSIILPFKEWSHIIKGLGNSLFNSNGSVVRSHRSPTESFWL